MYSKTGSLKSDHSKRTTQKGTKNSRIKIHGSLKRALLAPAEAYVDRFAHLASGDDRLESGPAHAVDGERGHRLRDADA